MPLSNYPVYCWTYLPMKETYPGMVKNWADLGINHPLTPIIREDDGKEAVLALLDECQEYGIKYIYKGKEKNYKVSKISIIKDTDWSMLENTEENELTLITCVENEPEYRRCVKAEEIRKEE